MSLAFLSKKSFHTAKLDNIEKVWIAEQKEIKEQQKLAELQKQLQEERQIQELRELQVRSGHEIKNADTSMNWMYQQGPASREQLELQNEEFLLGKIFKPKTTSNSVNESLLSNPLESTITGL